MIRTLPIRVHGFQILFNHQTLNSPRVAQSSLDLEYYKNTILNEKIIYSDLYDSGETSSVSLSGWAYADMAFAHSCLIATSFARRLGLFHRNRNHFGLIPKHRLLKRHLS